MVPADAASRVRKAYDEDKREHDDFVRDCERAYRAYRGVVELGESEADDWWPVYTPRIIFQKIEAIVAGLLDPRPRWRLVPSARFSSPPDIQDVRSAAAQLELLLNFQRKTPGFLRDQRAHRLQALICRVTAQKIDWDFREQAYQRTETVIEPVFDEFGNVIGQVPKVTVVEGKEVIRDDPKAEVVDVRHLVWPQSAVSAETAKRITHRLYLSYDDLKRRECKALDGLPHDGPCKGGIYHNVDLLKEKREGGTSASEANAHSNDLFSHRPHQDDFLVLEHWHRAPDGQVWMTVISDGDIVLRHLPSPFDHGKFPFVVCSGTPYPFRVQGISDVEMLIDYQDAIRTLGSQRLANVKLANNAIVLMREDVDDPDAFEFFPGAKNQVTDPASVQMWTPNVDVSRVSLEAEALLKRDADEVSGGALHLQGDFGSSGGTATEASLSTSLAQRRVAAKRQFFLEADAEVGNHFIDLNDQFLTEKRWLQIVGEEGVQGWELIDPDVFRELQFRIEIDAMDESLMREQRRAEKQAMLQTLMTVAPAAAAMGVRINPKAPIDDFLESHDVRDKSRYYMEAPEAPQPQPNGMPGTNGQAPNAEELLNAVSAPQATDVNSPSNAFSQSPVAALQRMGAMTGREQ